MKKLLMLGAAAIALATAVTAQAGTGLGLRGETGLARTPLTIALPPMTLAVAADHVASDDVFIPIRAEFGVIQGLEVGGNYWYVDTEGSSTVWGLNAKYVLPEFYPNLGLALGGHYRKYDIGEADNDGHDLYAAASYRIGFLMPTLGVRYESITGDNGKSDLRVFGSLTANVLPTLAIGFEIESASDKIDKLYTDVDPNPAMWFGVRFEPLEALSVQAGLLNYADIGAPAEDQKDFVFHIGLQYAFSFAR